MLAFSMFFYATCVCLCVCVYDGKHTSMEKELWFQCVEFATGKLF